MLKTGDKAPSFKLASTTGGEVSSSELKGRKFVLYFYPKDDTPGCTREACDFRDNLARLRREGVEVLGVSKDSIASHGKFRTKYDLPFDLLSDEDNAVARAYGAYGEKSMYGKKVLGTIRSTYLIDENGRVDAVWSPVKVDGHVERVLERLRGGEDRPAKKKASKKK
jgi:peroxiredoxin Q/BCP